MKKITFFIVFTLAVANLCFAQDNDFSRYAAADRYLNVVPLSALLNDTYSEIAMQLPEGQRRAFIAQMQKLINADSLELIARESMVATFTTDELNALADFYGSQHGSSSMKKFGAYMAKVMPAIQVEMQRAIQQIDN